MTYNQRRTQLPPRGLKHIAAPFCLVPFTFFQTVFMHNKYRASLWGIKVYQACFMFCHISKELWAQGVAHYISYVTSLTERWSLLWIYDLLSPAWSNFPPPSVNTDVAFCPGFSLLVIFVVREILKNGFQERRNVCYVVQASCCVDAKQVLHPKDQQIVAYRGLFVLVFGKLWNISHCQANWHWLSMF